MTTQNFDYYRQRAEEEMAAAEQAGDPSISNIHLEMARLYSDLLSDKVGGVHSASSLAEPMGGAIAESGPVPA